MKHPDLRETIAAALDDHRWGFSVGAFGAIAEFHQDEGEPATVAAAERLVRATARGAVAIEQLADAVPIAYETVSAKPERWGQGLALCLPAGVAAATPCGTLQEVGPDRGAIRPADRNARLFDLGLGLPSLKFCVRTADPELVATLRSACGRSIFDPVSVAMPAILGSHPHRVAVSAVGRVEVYQKIGGPETGGVSPEGPHTHLLPKLLASRRTHTANTPIPDGLVPCAELHPPSPLVDRLGRPKPFDAENYTAFEQLMAAWGVPDLVETKRRVRQALDAGMPPTDFPEPETRFARAALRVALRQRRWTHGASPVLDAWQQRFDPPAAPPSESAPREPAHDR